MNQDIDALFGFTFRWGRGRIGRCEDWQEIVQKVLKLGFLHDGKILTEKVAVAPQMKTSLAEKKHEGDGKKASSALYG